LISNSIVISLQHFTTSKFFLKPSRTLVSSFFIAVIFIAVKGYTFNSGDQGEHLPLVYKLINASLYTNDYFVTASNHTFTIRFFYVWLIYLFHFIMPIAATCFLFQLLSITAIVWSLQGIALHFKTTPVFALTTSFITVILFNNFTIGGNALLDVQLTASNFAAAFGAFAFYFSVKKRWYSVAVCAGIASLFQVLVGLQVMMLLTLLYFVFEETNKNIIAFVKMCGVYLLTASPMLIPIVYLQLQPIEYSQSSVFYHILYQVRNPNHYLPSAFPVHDYLRFGGLSVVAAILHFFVDSRLKQIWRVVFITGLVGMIGYTLLLEQFNYLPIGKLQWFKVSSWMMMMNVIVIVHFLAQLISNQSAKLFHLKLSRVVMFTGSMVVLLIILNSQYIPIERLKYRYHIGNYPITNLERMHTWIKMNTPVDAVILTSPDDDSFLCEAQRSMPIGWKAIVHEPFFLLPWYDKFIATYHNDKPFIGFNVLKQAMDNYAKNPPLPTTKLNWEYRLVNLHKGVFIPDREIIVHREGEFALVKIQTNPTSM